MRATPWPLTLAGILGLASSVTVMAQTAENNFGFPVGFSVEKMDRGADPRTTFQRYAAGRWLDAAVIPGDSVRISGLDVLTKSIERQLQAIVQEASRTSAAAPMGSPQQQVGDFYASGMDESRLAALGVTPLKPLLDRITASHDRRALAEALAELALNTDEAFLIGVGLAMFFAYANPLLPAAH